MRWAILVVAIICASCKTNPQVSENPEPYKQQLVCIPKKSLENYIQACEDFKKVCEEYISESDLAKNDKK